MYGILGYVAGLVFYDNFAEVEHLARLVGWCSAGVVAGICLIALVILRLRYSRHILNKAEAKERRREPVSKL